MRRLTRLTLAFSKKWENFEAAVALHFAAYNLVWRHATLRMTPAMAAGIEWDFWSYEEIGWRLQLMNYIERSRKAIMHLHGCDAYHVETVSVKEVFDGKSI